MGSHKMSRLGQQARILKDYIEALTRLSHIHSQTVSSPRVFQSCNFGRVSWSRNDKQNAHFKDQRGVRPQLPGSSSWVKLVVYLLGDLPNTTLKLPKTFFCFILGIFYLLVFYWDLWYFWFNFYMWVKIRIGVIFQPMNTQCVPKARIIEKLFILHWFINPSKIKQPATCCNLIALNLLSLIIIVLLIP